MVDLVSLSARRWRQNQDPAAHSIPDMLAEVMRQVEAGELNASHVIVAFSLDDDEGGVRTGWLQAGSLSPLGQVGLLTKLSREMMTPA